jgi:alcohol dehydrogenase class IV
MIAAMGAFEFQGLPWNVVFGRGSIRRLPSIVGQQRCRRALVLTTPGGARNMPALRSILGDVVAGAFAGAAVHVPRGVVAEALRAGQACGADCTISVGGGSTTGLGKMLRKEAGLPQFAVPTTYAGSEMTPFWGITDSGVKHTGRDAHVLPAAVIYDPELLAGLPPTIAGPSALNAMAQAVANISTNPIAGMLSREAIRVLAGALPRVMGDINNAGAHEDVLLGACLAGAALGVGRTGLHHRLCHALGGMFGLPHAETHAVILPYSVAFLSGSAREDADLVGAALGARDPAGHLYEMLHRFCPRHSLQALGLSMADIEAAADATAAESGHAEAARRLLRRAHAGEPPGSDIL